MLKHLLKACGVLSIVIFSSSNISAQTTTLTLKNNNADCAFDYKVYYNTSGCGGTMIMLSGTCAASSQTTETIPSGSKVVSIFVEDPTSLDNVTVYDPHCGADTGSYDNCDSANDDVYYDWTQDVVTVTP